jgi:glutathione S-transferase
LGEGYSALDPYLYTLAGWLASDEVDIAEFPVIADHYRRMSERPSVVRTLAAETV